MIKRRHLPETRPSMTHRIAHTPVMNIFVSVGFFEQSKPTRFRRRKMFSYTQPGEVFIKIGKEGSTLAGMLNGIGVLMSLLLQYNVPWKIVARKMRDTTFEPCDKDGQSILHSVVTAVDIILEKRGTDVDRGYF